MWLLNTVNRQLEHFGATVPPYAILSHRWSEGEEATFDDFQPNGTIRNSGCHKIHSFCDLIQSKASVRYVWADTCCINKASSAELSEAINSMYEWYSNAERCYVYLNDVSDSDVSDSDKSAFERSEWFTRGWTLQELLAPQSVEFYDENWAYLGDTQSLRSSIVGAAGLPQDIFDHRTPDGRFDPSFYSVADRMSWASNRETSRIEDRAYSLLGLFGVNMPLIYGEGVDSYFRLQKKIMKQCEDSSVFAWQKSCFPGYEIMAHSPSSFARDNPVERWDGLSKADYDSQARHGNQSQRHMRGTTITSAGIGMRLMLIPYCYNMYLVPVCRTKSENGHRAKEETLCMVLKRGERPSVYKRVLPDGQHLLGFEWGTFVPTNAQTRTILLEHGVAEVVEGWKKPDHVLRFEVCEIDTQSAGTSIDTIARQSNHESGMLQMHADHTGVAGMVRLKMPDGTEVYLMFGHDFDYKPFCLAMRSDPALMFESTGTESHELFCFPSISQKIICATSAEDIMSLVMSMQDIGLKSLPRHSLELHQPSQSEQQPTWFYVQETFYVDLKFDGRLGYGVWIKDWKNGQHLSDKIPVHRPSFESSWSVKPWFRDATEHDEKSSWKKRARTIFCGIGM